MIRVYSVKDGVRTYIHIIMYKALLIIITGARYPFIRVWSNAQVGV